MRRALFITLVVFVGIALGFGIAGMPRRSVDRPLSARPNVTTTTDPATAPAGVDASTGSSTTTTAAP
jgi:hypothetical protein